MKLAAIDGVMSIHGYIVPVLQMTDQVKHHIMLFLLDDFIESIDACGILNQFDINLTSWEFSSLNMSAAEY